MTVSEQITYLEKNAKKDLDDMLPKDRMTYYQQLKEYEVPKLSRVGFVQDQELPERIELILVK